MGTHRVGTDRNGNSYKYGDIQTKRPTGMEAYRNRGILTWGHTETEAY